MSTLSPPPWLENTQLPALERALHGHGDVYRTGDELYPLLRSFLPKLAAASSNTSAASSCAAAASTHESAALAERLGLPPPHRYDASLRLRVRVHTRRAAPPGYETSLSRFEAWVQSRSFARILSSAVARAELPVSASGVDIAAAVRSHPVLVLGADTGAGKSTQVPQFLLRAGFRRIAVTQPRRLAAQALAARVAEETLHTFGASIGYRVRFDSTASAHSAVTFLTEGVLLRELASDPSLQRYDVVVLDEAHERHVSTDLLLGLLRRLVTASSKLKLVVMSATINLAKMSAFFGHCPVICVPGRTHAITVEHVPALGPDGEQLHRPSNAAAAALAAKGGKQGSGGSRIDPAPYLRLLQRIDASVPETERGDVLVFLSGAAEIDSVLAALAPYAASSRRWALLPLHAGLPASQQSRVFEAAPSKVRKCVLATNVAETSITIEGIRYVIDSGRAKLMRHDAASFGGVLREGWISAAAAAQRAGRAGRTGPGHVYRLYSPDEFSQFECVRICTVERVLTLHRPFSPPEIQRCALESVFLTLASLAPDGLLRPADFPWLDRPEADEESRALEALRGAGALDSIGDAYSLTPLGRALAGLPADLAPAKLLLLSALAGVLSAGAALAASLSLPSPLRPASGDAAAARAELLAPSGDPLTALACFGAWAAARNERRTDMRRWCRHRALDESRLSEMAKLHRQLQSAVLGRSGAAPLLLSPDGGSGSEGEAGGRRRLREAEAEERVAQRRRLRRLQRRRQAAATQKVLSLRADGCVACLDDDEECSGEEGESEADAAAMRALELQLGADVEGAAGLSRLGAEQEAACVAILVLALYPRVAVPSPANASRGREHAYATRARGDCALHPGSALAPRPDGGPPPPGPGEAVLFAETLETHRAFLLGAVRAPAALLLLAATRVECDEAASAALLDGWLLLRFPAGGGEALARAARLRAMVEAALGARLGVAPAASAAPAAELSGPPLPDWAAPLGGVCAVPSPAELADALAAFALAPPACALSAAGGAAAVAGMRREPPRPALGAAGGGAAWLWVGALRAEADPLARLAATPHLRAHWACPACGAQMVATAEEAAAHRQGCGS